MDDVLLCYPHCLKDTLIWFEFGIQALKIINKNTKQDVHLLNRCLSNRRENIDMGRKSFFCGVHKDIGSTENTLIKEKDKVLHYLKSWLICSKRSDCFWVLFICLLLFFWLFMIFYVLLLPFHPENISILLSNTFRIFLIGYTFYNIGQIIIYL